jgi:hypothetical protein
MFRKILIFFIVLAIVTGIFFFPGKGDEYVGYLIFTSVIGLFLYYLIMMIYKFIFPFSPSNLAPQGSADGVLAIFMDKNEKDIHLFSYNSTSRVKTGESRLHLVQHYFIEGDTGKSYYHPLFSFSARTAKGRGGYEGYESFEKDVIPTVDFDESMNKFSMDLGRKLQLGQKFYSEDEKKYVLGDYRKLNIQTVEKELSRELSAVYINQDTQETIWTVRI